MSAIATEDQIVTQKTVGVVFLARRRNLKLVHTPSWPIYGPNGMKQGETKARRLEFVEGRLEVHDPELVAWLRRHPMLDDVSEGFWEVTPSAPDVKQEELDALMEAVLDGRLDVVRQVVEDEEANWQREAILSPARRALERLQAVYDAQQAEGEPEDAPKRAPRGR